MVLSQKYIQTVMKHLRTLTLNEPFCLGTKVCLSLSHYCECHEMTVMITSQPDKLASFHKTIKI